MGDHVGIPGVDLLPYVFTNKKLQLTLIVIWTLDPDLPSCIPSSKLSSIPSLVLFFYHMFVRLALLTEVGKILTVAHC